MLVHTMSAWRRLNVALIAVLLAWGLLLSQAHSDDAPNADTEASLKGFGERLANPSGERAKLRAEILDFRLKHPGTLYAAQASGLLSQLRSPLDNLNAANIPALERFPDWQPKELVGVIGEHRGRHAAPVSCVAFSSDGTLVASGGSSYVRLWDAPTLRLHSLASHSSVTSLAFSRDSKALVVGGAGGSVTVWDIAKVGQLNLLGLIPHQADDPESQSARLALAIYEAPQSMVAEQFRQVRTRLQHSASLDTVRSLLVTGTSPGDGKTTVACNLAAGLALNGRRILLVDANFRRPQVHAVFNLPNDLGFGDVLNSLDVFDDAIRETEVPNLSVLTCGAKSSNPTELLESQLLIDFIERALEEYDHVIFDSGPLLLVSETSALAPRVDGVVTVVRARGNSRGLLQRLRDQLRQLKAEHLGVILNAVRSQSGGYYAPMIKSYYAYQNS